MTNSKAPGSTTSRGPARTQAVKQEVPAVTSIAGDVLRRAAARIERPDGGWVAGDPSRDETCAVDATIDAGWPEDFRAALKVLEKTVKPAGLTGKWSRIATWNLEQPSRATVAAEMRSAGDLADLLYGGAA